MKMLGTAGADRSPAIATFKRELPVAIERAYDAWTSSRLLARWLLPAGSTTSSVLVDPRRGGLYRIEGLLPQGAAFSISGIYLVVEEPTKLAMSWSYHGPAGPLRDDASIVTVDFVARSPRLTGITVTHERASTQAAIELP